MASIILLASSPLSLKALVIAAFVAGLGGLFVLVGLLAEHRADKIVCKTPAEEKRKKRKKELGFWVLIIGILIEIVDAVYHGAHGLQEMNRIKNEAPINLPLTSVTASLIVTFPGPLQYASSNPSDCSMEMCESNVSPRTLVFGQFQQLLGKNVNPFETRSTGPVTHSYSVTFTKNEIFPFFEPARVIADGNPVTAAMVTYLINNLRLRMAFIPPQSEILGGGAQLVINETFTKTFSVPPQKTDKDFYFYATNSP